MYDRFGPQSSSKYKICLNIYNNTMIFYKTPLIKLRLKPLMIFSGYNLIPITKC